MHAKPLNIQPKLTRRARSKAQGTLEFALASGLFLLLVFAIIEFGYLLYIYGSVFSAAREAARFGTSVGVNASNVTHDQDCTGMKDAAVRIGGMAGVTAANTIVRYDTGPTDTRAYDSLPACDGTYSAAGGDRVVVKITVRYTSLTGIIPSMDVTNTDARTIIKGMSVAGNFPTPPLVTYTATPADAAHPTFTPGPTKSATATVSGPTSTFTRTATATATYTATATGTHTPTITATHTDTPTITPSFTATATITPTFTWTPTITPTFTATVPACSGITATNKGFTDSPTNTKWGFKINNTTNQTWDIDRVNASWSTTGLSMTKVLYGSGSIWTGTLSYPGGEVNVTNTSVSKNTLSSTITLQFSGIPSLISVDVFMFRSGVTCRVPVYP